MANFNVWDAQNPDGSSVHDLVEAAQAQGRLRTTIATWVADGTEGASPTIPIAKLPLGAYVVSAVVKVNDAVVAGAGTIGDSEDADRYVAGLTLSAVGIQEGTPNVAGFLHKIANAAQQRIDLDFTAGVPLVGDSVTVLLTWSQT